MIKMSNTNIKSIDSLTIENANMTAIWIDGSTITSITKLMVSNVSLALKMDNSHAKSVSQSNFVNCGQDTNIYGGAIKSVNSNFTIMSSKFSTNAAQSGGAIAIL